MATKGDSKTKYDGLLANRKEPAKAEPPTETQAAAPMAPPAAQALAKPGKPLAKSKDPSKAPYTLILDIDTHTDAKALLKKLRMGGDLSDLTQKLLSEWVKEHAPKVA